MRNNIFKMREIIILCLNNICIYPPLEGDLGGGYFY